jgi:hypothetical protein
MANENATDRLVAASGEAVDTIIRIMRDPQVSWELRLEAAKEILRSGELTSRVTALEKVIREASDHAKWSLPG